MRKALILAAGTATRMHPLTLDRAKCVLPLGETTSIRYQLECLAACGIDEAVVVVGWKAEQVEAEATAAQRAPRVRFVHNPFYDFHGCECSMSLAHAALADASSVLIVEGDLLMPPALFRTLLEHPSPTAVLMRRVEIDPRRSVVVLGRDERVSAFVYDQSHQDVLALVPDQSAILGESLQVWKFGGDGLTQLLAAFRAFQANLGATPDLRNGLYSINQALPRAAMAAVAADDAEWINLNTVEDLERARSASWLIPF
jgi:choline kinase